MTPREVLEYYLWATVLAAVAVMLIITMVITGRL